MAESESGQEKSEEPTGKRQEQFREEGQVAKSREINSLVTIGIGFMIFGLIGPRLGENVLMAFKGAFEFNVEQGVDNAYIWISHYVTPVLYTLGLFALFLFLVTLASNLMQVGILLAWKALTPKMENVSPKKGLKKIFSTQTIVEFAKSFLKVCFIGLIVYMDLNGRLEELLALSTLPLFTAIQWCLSVFAVLLLKISIFLSVLAVADFMYQKHTTMNQMKMTKQEVKDEMKDQQSSPHVRGKVAQIAGERARKSIQKEVPTADVIITNPTHYAVAIRYRRFQDHAPIVVAKGKNILAQTIKKMAEENNVPIYEFPPLARQLYKEVPVGRMISAELFESVARVLAYVYRLKNKTGLYPEGGRA